MAKTHIWERETFSLSLCLDATAAIKAGFAKGWDYEKVLRFTGFFLEARSRTRHGYQKELSFFLSRVENSKHRYAKGKNKDNYLKAGEMLLQWLGQESGLAKDTPASIVWDRLQDTNVLVLPI